MKHLLGAFALLLSTCVFAFGQTEQPKQQEKDMPTLDETVKWLSQKLPSMAAYEGKSKTGATITLRVVTATFDGYSCTLSAQQEITLSRGGRTNDSVTYVFSLASLDPEKISVERSKLDSEPQKYDLILNAKDGKKAIKHATFSRSDLYSPRSYESMTNIMALSFDNEETARRFEKAFKHAARLSQASSKEPF